MAIKHYNGFVPFEDYLLLAREHGLSSLSKIADATYISIDILKNLSSRRREEKDWQQRFFYLDAKDRGWV
jgi:hypothetical protein